MPRGQGSTAYPSRRSLLARVVDRALTGWHRSHPEDMEDFEFNCWKCWETNVIQGRPKGFWTTTHYEVPSEWDCWSCGASNSTPDD
ncbi:hypothetical protein ABZ371_00020 [Streptomyces sp. NPDC005899]|uniref:hypothetical protein n=1 Tax=Streptomyces sp. NPDC005899 TaxID=3155716 RepID=UPI00340902C3